MSYTKMNGEIVKWLKANDLPYKGTANDTKDQTEKRLAAYRQGRDVVFETWLSQKKYKALISVAHKGWFPSDEFFNPLAEHFVRNKDLIPLKFLCERGIRFAIEDMMFSVKTMQSDFPAANLTTLNAINLEEYALSNTYSSVGETAKWRKLALDRIDRYMLLIKQMPTSDYVAGLSEIRDKVDSLQIKTKDLSGIKTKLKSP